MNGENLVMNIEQDTGRVSSQGNGAVFPPLFGNAGLLRKRSQNADSDIAAEGSSPAPIQQKQTTTAFPASQQLPADEVRHITDSINFSALSYSSALVVAKTPMPERQCVYLFLK
ncbi:hypothetical protein QAD02_013219 [Eretmocerus hayati]|uniref:Uncharacterized protein n=1 Tax=Eretmocerus hayati TaxID=131215 RepID=A0ACC2P226_9HYME|nr:hypothetical protein QAD02_013219 [Eretmocerus hayati]